MTRLVFLYGTLLDPGVLAAKSGSRALARRLRLAVLPGWRRVVLRGTPYPTLRHDPGCMVGGALCRPDAAALRRLRAYEGAEYRLIPVRVVSRGRPLRARAWIAPRWRASLDPWRGDQPKARRAAGWPSSAASGIGRPSR